MHGYIKIKHLSEIPMVQNVYLSFTYKHVFILHTILHTQYQNYHLLLYTIIYNEWLNLDIFSLYYTTFININKINFF